MSADDTRERGPRVLVTGATGHVGAGVVEELLSRGERVTASARDASRASDRFGPRVRAARLDFYAEDTWRDALHQVDRVFLMRPPAISDVSRINAFVDLAWARGVTHVVFLSVVGADRNRWVPHRAIEQHLTSRAMGWTILRPGFFAQNLISAYRRDIVDDGRLYVPAGTKRDVNWIDARDIAEVAAAILHEPDRHRGCVYTLTGPGAVSWTYVAERLAAALGRKVRYEPASLVGYMRHLHRRGIPLAQVAVQTVLHALLRLGQGEAHDPTLARLLGRAPRSVDQFIRDHAGEFTGHRAAE